MNNELENLRGFTDHFSREFVIPQIDFWLRNIYKVPKDLVDDIEIEHYEGMENAVQELHKIFSPPYYEHPRFPFHEVVISVKYVKLIKGVIGDNYRYLKHKIKQKDGANSDFLNSKNEKKEVETIERYVTQIAPSLKDSLEAQLYTPFTLKTTENEVESVQTAKMYDVFICHASEDKEFTDKLAEALRDSGVKVWYDEFIIDWGGSIRNSIDAGLRESRFGIVVFSKAFLSKKKWTEYELSGLISRESAGSNIILPILHGVTISELREYSPSLSDRLAKDSQKDSIPEIVTSLINFLQGK